MNTTTHNIGSVVAQKDGSYVGTLTMLNYRGPMIIRTNADKNEKSAENTPDFIVSTSNARGEETVIGAAWNNTAKSSGNPYIKVKIDHFEIVNRPVFGNLAADRTVKNKLNLLVS